MRCVPFSLGEISGVLTVSSGPGQWLIRDGDHEWRFNWNDRWGALRVRKDGGTAGQPEWRSRFWMVTALWARQGKRTEQAGREILALWDRPPPSVTRYRQIGKRTRLIVECIEPPGFDPVYSEEIYEAVE